MMRIAVAVATTRSDLQSFHLAHPVIRATSRFDLTAVAVLSILDITIWLVVLPLEFALRLTV
jgi:hypothetical protein